MFSLELAHAVSQRALRASGSQTLVGPQAPLMLFADRPWARCFSLRELMSFICPFSARPTEPAPPQVQSGVTRRPLQPSSHAVRETPLLDGVVDDLPRCVGARDS